MTSVELRAHSSAPIETVWRVLVDNRNWSRWTFVPRSELEREGDPPPDGVGAIRKFGAPGFWSREEVVAWEPPTRWAYTLHKGLPVRDYLAEVTLRPDGDGTAITWASRFEPKIPGTAALLRAALKVMLGSFARNLGRYAERLEVAGDS